MVIFLYPSNVQATDVRDQADQHLKLGNTLFSERQYDRALDEFLKAYALYPSYKIAYNLASTYYLQQQPAEAATFYAQFLAAGDRLAPRASVKQARARLEKLSRGLAIVRLTCREARAEVRVDGAFMGRTPLAAPLYLLPGTRQVLVVHGQVPLLSVTLTLKAGEDRRLSAKDGAEAAPRPADARARPRPVSEDQPEAEPSSKRPSSRASAPRPPKRVAAYILLGTGFAFTATAVVLYSVGGVNGSEVYGYYQNAKNSSEAMFYREQVDTYRGMLTAGHVFAGIAVASLASGVVLLLTGSDEAKASLAASGQGRWAIAPSRDGAMVSFSRSF